ncbi:polycystin-1-like protein 2 [Clarias gariepinus]
MVSCPENQKAFNGSCYEFVTLQMSFVHGQASCENSGGHLAFIHNEETQQFLQKHLQPKNNWWIGLASTSFSLSSKESGQSLACLDNHALLKCDSGQVIEIDESFYGRNTMHYCRANSSLLHTSVQDSTLPHFYYFFLQLLESMSTSLLDAMTHDNTHYLPDEITVLASSVLSFVTHENLLTPNITAAACSLLDKISKDLISSSDGNSNETSSSALPIVLTSSILLKHSAADDQQTSETLLRIMDQVQSALLTNKSINMDPILLSSPLINLYVNRLTPDYLFEYPISTENISVAFTLPSSVSSLVPSNEPVNLRMMSFGINPYAWNKEVDISGTVGSLSLSSDDGSVIPVENLNEEIEILLPRLDVVDSNQTFLNLTSYSTMAINVTAPNTSLVLKLEPSDETPLMLHLGFQYYPNDTKYVAKIQFPQAGDSQVGKYTWVLTPKDVALEVGIYYLLVRPIVPAGVNSTNVTVFITSIAANCKYWNESNNRWSEHGCRVGPLTTSLFTQCLCTHLTSFGSSFFVMPNTVDVSRTAELFSTFANNPVVVCFVGALFLAYIITMIWARKKDLQDKIKVRITVLEDNDPLAEYRYLVAVTTGHRHGAATTSNVTLTLKGTVWESKPHHLTDPEKPVFTRGAVDIFLLTTPFSLGDLQSIRMWHDNSGEHPDWYVNKVMVQDLETGEMWHFLCNSWLAIDNGDCTLDKVFTVASETDLKGFNNLFFTKTVKDLCDGHIWYSVVNRPASSNFTRVQRLSCCFSLLLCTMLTSIMFWGIPKNPSEQDMELGTIKFNLQQLMIGIQSSIIMFPVNVLIVTIFRSTRPRKKKEVSIIQQSKSGSSKQAKKIAERWRIQTDITVEIVVKELKKIVCVLAKAVKCPIPSAAEESETTDINTLLLVLEDIIRQQNFNLDKFNVKDMEDENLYKLYLPYLYNHLWNFEKELRLLDPSQFPKSEGYIQAVLQLQSMKLLLEPYLYSKPMSNKAHMTGPEEEQKKKWYQKGLPWWFVIVGWILIAATSGVSAYFTMMYGLTYGKERSISWLISISVSFFQSLFVTQPLKVLGLAVFFALVVKSVENQDENMFQLLKDMTLTYSEDPDDIRISRRDSTCRFYQPPPPADIEKMKENYIKNLKAVALIKEIIIYFAFLCVLLLTTYGQRDPNAYYLTRHIQQSFSTGITDSMSPGNVFNWANDVLISNLFGQRPGFITDGNSKLVGSARLRQVRVLKDSCRISKAMQQGVYDCNAAYSWALEDMGSYGPNWNHSKDVNIPTTLLIPWQYQTQSKLRGHPIWGTMAFYRGGGFVLDLGLDPQQASSMLQYLFNKTWLDVYTRAIFVEFTVYNANVNLFCIVTLMLETTALGAFQYSSELHILRLYQTTDGINIVASEVIYFLFILYYMFLQIKRIKHQKLQYFRSKFNLLELSIILLSLAALGAIINRTIQGNKDLQYFQEHRDHFPSFCDTASADSSLGYILAFLILLGTVKMWHLMRLNSKMNLIISTLQRAWNDLTSFIVVLIIMLLAYSLVSNLLFGWILYTYRTVQDSMLAIIALQLGIFNYEEVLDINPVLGAFLILSCVILMTFVVLNFFISVVLEAFSQRRKHYKPSEEEEIADLMTRKICKMFGIPVKKKC